MKTFAARITYRPTPKESAGYLAILPNGREVAVGAALAKSPSSARPTPPPHVMSDLSGWLLTVPPDGRLVYEQSDGEGWTVHAVEPDPRPMVTRCLSARRVPNFASYPYWGVGIYQAVPRQEDGVWTWRADDWAETWVYPGKGQFQPRGYRSISAVPLREWAERLGLPVMAVTHGQKVSQ